MRNDSKSDKDTQFWQSIQLEIFKPEVDTRMDHCGILKSDIIPRRMTLNVCSILKRNTQDRGSNVTNSLSFYVPYKHYNVLVSYKDR